LANFSYLPLFPRDYIADTRHLSLEEHGAYLQLLQFAWLTPECRIVDNDRRICAMLNITPRRWQRIKPAVMAFWTLDDGYWYQPRLHREYELVKKIARKNSAAARTRWQKEKRKSLKNNESDNATAPLPHMPPSPSPSPSHSTSNQPPTLQGPRAPQNCSGGRLLTQQETQSLIASLEADYGNRNGPKAEIFREWKNLVTGDFEWRSPSEKNIRKHLDEFIRRRA